MGLETAIALGALAVSAAGVGLSAKESSDAKKQGKKDRATQSKREAIANLQRAALGETGLSPAPLPTIPQGNVGQSLQQLGKLGFGTASALTSSKRSAEQDAFNQSNTEARQAQQQAQFQQSQQLRALIAASQLGQEDPMRQTFLRDGLGVQTGPLPQDPFLQTVGGRLNRQ